MQVKAQVSLTPGGLSVKPRTPMVALPIQQWSDRETGTRLADVLDALFVAHRIDRVDLE